MGKIKKILENELVGGTQTTDVYPITSTKAVYDTDNIMLDTYIQHLKKTHTFAGVATPSTNPDALDHRVFYLAWENGNYPRFNDINVNNEVAVLTWSSGKWTKTTINIAEAIAPTLNIKADKKELAKKVDLEEFNNTVLGINANIVTKANAQDVTNAIGELQDKIGDRVVVSGNVTNNPDEEDITTEGDTPQTQVLKLKDRAYDSLNASGKGYKILRKNWQLINGERKNVLTQAMINEPNTIYEIRYDFDLDGAEISIKDNCVLRFEGGSLNNGKVKNAFYYRGIIKGSAIYLSNSKVDNSNVSKCTTPLYYNILSGNISDYYNTSLSEDLDICKRIDRYSLIENVVFRNEILHKGIAITTEGVTSPQENTIRKTVFERYNIGIQFTKNGYSSIHDCNFYNNNRSIVIDNEDKWIGSLFISNCHIMKSSIGIESSIKAVLKLDNITLENCDTSFYLGGSVIAKNIYIGDQANKETPLRGVIIKEGANVTIKDSSLGLSAPESSSLEHYLFELQGTDDSPCTLTLINCSVNLTNQYATNLHLFKSNSSKNIIRLENVTVWYSSVNMQHSFAISTIVNSAIIPVNESIKNYILNGYFDDDYINTILIGQGVQRIDTPSLYSNVAFKYSKQSIIFFYHIPKECINQRMYLEIGVVAKDSNAIVTLNTSSDITAQSNIELSKLGYDESKIVSNRFYIIPTKEMGKIIFNNIPYNPDKSSNIVVSYAKLYSIENKNILDKGAYYSHNRATGINSLIHNFSTYSDIDGGHILDNDEKIASLKDSVLNLNTKAISLKDTTDGVQDKNSLFVKNGNLCFINANRKVYNLSPNYFVSDFPVNPTQQPIAFVNKVKRLCIFDGTNWVDHAGCDPNLRHYTSTSSKLPSSKITASFLCKTIDDGLWHVFDGTNWDTLERHNPTKKYGAFVDRPSSNLSIGFQYFNTDTHKMITWDGSKWWNPDGTEATN